MSGSEPTRAGTIIHKFPLRDKYILRYDDSEEETTAYGEWLTALPCPPKGYEELFYG